MPCACKNNQPEYPVTDNWGPSLWKILHALAERGGKVVIPSFREDEKRQWILLIEIMPKMIPCEDCRGHAQQWILAHPIKLIKDIPSDEIYEWITTWVYEFHEAVNQRTGKQPFDKLLLPETYGRVDLNETYKAMKPFIESAIRLSGISLFPWQNWSNYLRMLSSLYGL